MLMVVKNNIKCLMANISCSLKTVMVYKLSFVVQVILMFINNGFFLVFWVTAFSQSGGSINGVNMNDIMYLWSVPVIAYGIHFFFLAGAENISKYVISGQLDTFLIQPKNPLVNILGTKTSFSAFGDILYGIVLLVFATNFNVSKIIIGTLLGILCSLFITFTVIIVCSLSFWVGDVSSFVSSYVHTFLITFTIYPEQIFNKAIRILLYTVVPAGYVAFIPIKLTIEFDLQSFLLLIGALAFYGISAIVIFNLGLKKYESGNMIITRE